MQRISVRRGVITTVALGLALTTVPAVADARDVSDTNAPVKVSLTVQGPDGLLCKGKIKTKGHDVTTATGGTHRCDGTNGGAHPTAVPTPTAALDDAARKRHFTWDGTWYASFDDYSVDTIKDVSGDGVAYWNISVNGASTPVGGCQFKLNAGDKVAFTWTAF
ncbi:DUF4430 domain-containing protein [Streptomyces sp. NRRL F-5065]|uniref:DUF4430 domain-containing protein n=1 Tax=Streptomyces sp. NRRL F-5065 TaxID=1463855 RepID=UPI0004C19D14|nr:DUF4430 domain-containing protein [Streptomyces sp. NRRL F-5065]